MDCRCNITSAFPLLSPSTVPVRTMIKTGFQPLRSPIPRRRLNLVVVAGLSRCDPSLNTPLQPQSTTGRYLISVLQNHRQLFHVALAEELMLLAADRDETALSITVTEASDEACLYKRIAEIKRRDWQVSIRDLMYAAILFKFGEMNVHLVPKLSKCIYNGRLEIWPAKDWELESIHGIDSLEMIKEHIATTIGLRADSSVNENWAIASVEQSHLREIYGASIVYGYFLKSASIRHNLELLLASPHISRDHNYRGINLLFGCMKKLQRGERSPGKIHEKLSCYVSGFDKETLQRCMKIRSDEGEDLMEKYRAALFGEEDEMIVTSFSSMKRLVLEAIAFGSFLWDVEEYVDPVLCIN